MSEREASSESPAPGTGGVRGPRAGRIVRGVAGAVTAALLVGAGLAGGWVAARQGTGHAGHGAEPEGEDAHGHAHGGATRLSPQTLANLGVEFAELRPTDFVRTRDVPGVLERRPDARRPVYAPVAGRLRKVTSRAGDRVPAGATLAEVVRDPFPRPVLTLTDAVLRPLNEDFHRSVAELRTAGHSLAIVREELARIRKILADSAGAGTLPTKTEIDLSYEERRADRALESARAEAKRHGLTDEEVAAVEAGAGSPLDQPPVLRILQRNGLWSPEAAAVHALLPEPVRALPFAAALLGELAGSHLLPAELVATLRARPRLAAAFLDVAGLLQEGVTVDGLVALDDAGGLAAVVPIVAPADAPDWDVASVAARDGAHVDSGSVIAELEDARTLVLRLAPTGPDVALLEQAYQERRPIVAVPLVDGTGPRCEGLTVLRLDAAEAGTAQASALVEVGNVPLVAAGGEAARTRTWALRPGLRYLARVPTGTLAGRFVLPADAVIPRGPDSVVLLKDGAGFRAVPVRVEYADASTVVVANDGAVFPGDTVAVKGAYALMLATQAGSGGGADPHAGHNHG